ncbi:MAG: PepSY domain-containing protein [Christensenellales bacterium]|jgi:hypothetical protein
MKPELRLNHRVLSAALPDMPPEAENRLRQQIRCLSAQQEEKPVKKRLSLGLVLALVITLLTLSALAAVLIGGKDFVEQFLAPRAIETESEIWTREELEELRRIAQEHGLPITDELQKAFDQPEGYYKQEVIHAVLRDSLGFYYSTWSVEDQAWYENILVKTGLKDFSWATVPEPGDVSLEEAREIAATYIQSAWGAEPELMNPEIYRHHQQFQNFKESEHHQGRRWYLEFEALDLTHDAYYFTIESTGKVIDAQRRPGVEQAEATAYDVLERYEHVYGDRESWEGETWRSFQERVRKAVAAHGDSGMGKLLNVILKQEYGVFTDEMITKETAIATARALPGAHEKVARATVVLLMDGDIPVWKVTLRHAFEEGKVLPLPFLAEINALTGEVRGSRLVADHSSPASYALDRLMEDEPTLPPPAAPNCTRRPDGKPGFWYSNRAPDYYWKALDEYGYNKGDQGDLIESWYKDYGSDQAFWPLEAQALIELWHGVSPLDGTFPGLPAPEDIPWEKALTIARKALLEDKETGLHLDENSLNTLAAQFSFSFHSLYPGSRAWQVGFVEYWEGQKHMLASVTIDAKTGKVLEISGGDKGNG